MKVAIYTRVSTNDQNIDTQIDFLKIVCKKENYEIYNIYKDIGQSGSKESRPEFDKLLNDMRKYKFHGILVYKCV